MAFRSDFKRLAFKLNFLIRTQKIKFDQHIWRFDFAMR